MPRKKSAFDNIPGYASPTEFKLNRVPNKWLNPMKDGFHQQEVKSELMRT